MIRPNISKVLNHHANNMRRQIQAHSKIATGKRINSAADDSGSISVSQTMLSKASSLTVAKRNIDEALQVATMADDGLSGISQTVERLRELAVQSANGTYTDTDRALLQKEYAALMADIETQVNGVKYNDIPLLTASNLAYTSNDAFTLDTQPPGSSTFGSSQGVASLGGRQAWVQNDPLSQLVVPMGSALQNNVRISVDVFLPSNANSSSILRPFSSLVAPPGLSSFLEMRQSNRSVDEVVVTERGGTPSFNDGSVIAQDEWVTMSMDVNQTTGEFTARLAGTELVSGTFSMANLAGSNLVLQAEAIGSANVGWSNINIESAPDSSLDIESGLQIQAGEELNESVNLKLAVKATTSDLGISSTTIGSRTSALAALSRIDKAIDSLATHRSEVGASANRLISEQASIMHDHVNMKNAASEIENVDMAEVSSELTSSQLGSGINLEVMKQMFQMDRVRIINLLEQRL